MYKTWKNVKERWKINEDKLAQKCSKSRKRETEEEKMQYMERVEPRWGEQETSVQDLGSEGGERIGCVCECLCNKESSRREGYSGK